MGGLWYLRYLLTSSSNHDVYMPNPITSPVSYSRAPVTPQT